MGNLIFVTEFYCTVTGIALVFIFIGISTTGTRPPRGCYGRILYWLIAGELLFMLARVGIK